MNPEDIVKLAQVLDIQQDSLEAELGSHWWPRRGLGPMPPQDPVLYRLFEVCTLLPLNIRSSSQLTIWSTGCARVRTCH